MLIAAFIPVVQYRLGFSVPGEPYTPEGIQICNAKFGYSINSTDAKAYQDCYNQYRYPPINITGSGSLTYDLLGVGTAPFPSMVNVSEGDQFYAILFTSGAKITAGEQVRANTLYDPLGITVHNGSISVGSYGQANMTVSFTNTSGQTVSGAMFQISIPGDTGNTTDKDGIVWMFSGSPTGGYGWCTSGRQFMNVTSGNSCTTVISPILDAPRGTPFRYTIQVGGLIGDRYFISRKTFSCTLPAQAVDQLWMHQFMGQVNQARSGPALTESSTLDSFAAMRFNTAASQPDIANYGFWSDVTRFFGANSTQTAITEVILYPGTQDPTAYAAQVQKYGPGHWSALTNTTYTHFGYYVGTGSYEIAKLPCPVFEVPGGANITQYLENAGCQVTIQPMTWLVIVLGK